MKNCPICNSNNLKIVDCGYTTFNRGHVECECGFKIDFKNLSGENEYKLKWNETLDYMDQITELPEIEKNSLLCAISIKERELMKNMLNQIKSINEKGI